MFEADNTGGFEFNPSDVDTVDQDAIETNGIRFPSIIFMGGDTGKRPKKSQPDPGVSWRGGFFISRESMPSGDLTAYGWTEDSFISRTSGNEVEGWYMPGIKVAHIARRRAWAVGQGKEKQFFPWHMGKQAGEAAKASGGHARGTQQSVVLVKGLEDLGPLCLSLSGHHAMAYNGDGEYRQTGCLSTFEATVIAKANAASKENAQRGVKANEWPKFCFWLPIQVSVDASGEPKFFEVGKTKKNMTALPVPVGLPKTAAEVNLNAYYVGPNLKAYCNDTYALLKDSGWLTAWNEKAAAEAPSEGAKVTAKKAVAMSEQELEEAGI